MYEVGDIAHYKDGYDHWHQSAIKHVGTNMLGEQLYGLEDGFWLLEDRIAFCERKEPEPFIIKEIPDSIIKNLNVSAYLYIAEAISLLEGLVIK